MPFGNFLPSLPLDFVTIAVNIVGIMGGIAMAYAVLLEAEKSQDAVFVVGSASMFVYALWLGNTIFAITMAAIFLLSGRELIQIIRGKHKHYVDCTQCQLPTKK